MGDFLQVLVVVWDIPAFIFHVSMIVMLVVQKIKKNVDMEGGFYVIFITVGILDTIAYIETIFIYRLPQYGLYREIFEDPPGNQTKINKWIAKFDNFIVGYSMVSDMVGHMIIAMNRFSAVFYYMKHDKLWNGKYLFLAIFLLLFIPLLDNYNIFFNSTIFFTPDGAFVNSFDDPNFANITNLINFGICLATTTISFILETSVIVKYRQIMKINTSFQQQEKYRKDFQLLVHSMIMLVLQCLIDIYFIVYFYATLTENWELFAMAIFIMFTFILMMFQLGSAIALFIVSKVVRGAYIEFYGFSRCFSPNNNAPTLFVSTTTHSNNRLL